MNTLGLIGKNFTIQEFVDPDTYNKFGDKSIWFIDQTLLRIVQQLRDEFGPITINNWDSGGNRKWSGLRTNSSPYYKPYSQHSFGRAADLLFTDTSIDDVSKSILSREYDWKRMGLGGIELGKSWLHIDTRNSNNLVKFYR